jgi:hypothetical protein
MQQPCRNCPFREGSVFLKTLSRERKQEIAHSILYKDEPFLCHKTTRLHKAEQKICVGSAVAMGDQVMNNVAYRINAMYGRLNINDLNREGILPLDKWLITTQAPAPTTFE